MISNDKLSSNKKKQENFYNDHIISLLIDDDQAAIQLAEAQKLHQQQQLEFLQLYRQSLARLQKEDPMAAASMPGINATDLEEREKDIVEEMGRIIYSKRYSDMNYQYRY